MFIGSRRAILIGVIAAIVAFIVLFPAIPDLLKGGSELTDVKIIIKNIYQGIDWMLYNSNQQGFKYDFIVHPGADYKKIELCYSSFCLIKIIYGLLQVLAESSQKKFL